MTLRNTTLSTGFGLSLVLALSAGSAWAETPPDFEGRYIAAISDADMRADAYIDGLLGEPRGEDALSLVALPPTSTEPTGALNVPNSVISPVFGIVASQDGNTIFVVETRTAREPGDETMNDLGSGTTLRAIDVSDLSTPREIAAVEVGPQPQGVDLSADGRTLVIATVNAEAPLSFVTFEEGAFGPVVQVPAVGFTPSPEFLDQGMLPNHAEWHPTEDIIAVTMNFRGQVQFYTVLRGDAGEVTGIEPFGNRVMTSKWPMSGKFSPDGRFFVTNDLQWGPDVRGFYVNAPPSQLTVIEMADPAADAPRHFVAGGASLPRHAESLAFSNDGTMLATVNIGQTWLEPGATGHSLSSLSLLEFDTETGQFTHSGDWTFDGILPEGIAFDASDSYVVVGVYEYDGPEPRRSALEFWAVTEAEAGPALAPTGYAVETGPGAHSLVVVN